MFNAGVALRATPKLTVALDWQWINYNQVDSIANSGSGALGQITNARQYALGADEGFGFGWEDMNIVKIGAEYKYSDKFNIRLGASHNDRNPYDSDQALFNILAPGVIRTHVTFGMEYKFFENASINLAYARGLRKSFSATHPNLGGGSVNHKMDQNEGTIGFSYKW